MTVKLIEIESDQHRIASQGRWLVPGKEYSVLEIYVDLRTGKIQFRIVSEEAQTPALFDSEFFQIVSNRLPHTWVVDISTFQMKVAPKSWIRAGFWEDFFDGESKARSEFNEELRLMVASVEES